MLSLLRKEIEARARLVEEIEACPVILANEARLVQVFTNLLMNAWQALPESDPTRHVVGVRTGSLAGDALIEIWDSGVGISPELGEQIFEPFVTTKEIGSGTGLGLFVCRNIVSALHGRITAHEAPGGGALFRIVLPAATDPMRASAPAPVNVAPVAARGGHQVLIIDDDPLVAGALASCLTQRGFKARSVLDAQRGLELLLAEDFELVYCDVMMRGFTGMDLYVALQQQAPQQLSKVVFMTGGAFTPEAQAFLEPRGNACVQKPFDILADARQRVGLTP
jgi:CheY-like chemotaxis protein